MITEIVIEAIETIDPCLAKIVVWIVSFGSTHSYIKREAYKSDQEEDNLNGLLSYIGASIILLVPDSIIEKIAKRGMIFLLEQFDVSELPPFISLLIWLSTLVVAAIIEVLIQIVLRYFKRVKYS